MKKIKLSFFYRQNNKDIDRAVQICRVVVFFLIRFKNVARKPCLVHTNNKGTDTPVHLQFDLCLLKVQYRNATVKISKLMLFSVAEQA